MNRILLADDSPHAQRMGERILREEGFEVVSLTDGETVLMRMQDVDPDLLLADAFLPLKSGFDLCRYVKGHPLHRHVRVVLTAGLLEQLDEDEATRAGCDAVLKKPFEASVVISTIRPLLAEAQMAREASGEALAAAAAAGVSAPVLAAPVAAVPPAVTVDPSPEPEAPPAPRPIDPQQVEAAVTLALDAAFPALVKEITERVLVALGH